MSRTRDIAANVVVIGAGTGALAILAGLSYVHLKSSVNHRRLEAASQIRTIYTGIAMYKADTGGYPALDLPAAPADFGSRVVDQLCPAVDFATNPSSKGKDYLLDLSDRVRVMVILDPWGRPYRFAHGPHEGAHAERAGVRIWSVGPNGEDEGGGGDDVME